MPKKKLSLLQIRREVKAYRRSTASVTNHSAFHRLEKNNERALYGRSVRLNSDPDDSTLPRSVPSKVKKPPPKKKRTIAKPKPKPAPEPKEPEIEYWLPAGGDTLTSSRETPPPTDATRILGIARVPGWKLERFEAGLKAEVARHGEVQDVVVQHVRDGAEEMADVYAVFRSEGVAEGVREGMEGAVVEGRRIRVGFA